MNKPALSITALADTDGLSESLLVDHGGITLVEGSTDEPSPMLLAAAGIEPLPGARIRVFGCPPQTVPTGTVSYVGPASPIIRGSLRRNLLLGVSGKQHDDSLLAAAARVGLADLVARLGGLDGSISEGGRNLGRLEAARLLVARAILDSAPLMLIDAAGLALPRDCLDQLIGKARGCAAATVVVVERERRPAEMSCR